MLTNKLVDYEGKCVLSTKKVNFSLPVCAPADLFCPCDLHQSNIVKHYVSVMLPILTYKLCD